MGEGALASIPLQLAGSRRILELMDWGNYDAMGTFINIGPIGIWPKILASCYYILSHLYITIFLAKSIFLY